MGNEGSQMEGGEGVDGVPSQPGIGGAPQGPVVGTGQPQIRPVPQPTQSQPPPQHQPTQVTPVSPTSMSRRGSSQLRRGSSSAGRMAVPAPPDPAPEVDLSNLSEEERALILSVMARAQSMEEDVDVTNRDEEPKRSSVSASSSLQEELHRPPQPMKSCPVCHVTELTNETASQCVECGSAVCKKCSTAIPSGKKHVWMCVLCAEKYPQLPQGRSKVSSQNAQVQPMQTRTPAHQHHPPDTRDHHADPSLGFPHQKPQREGQQPVPAPRSAPEVQHSALVASREAPVAESGRRQSAERVLPPPTLPRTKQPSGMQQVNPPRGDQSIAAKGRPSAAGMAQESAEDEKQKLKSQIINVPSIASDMPRAHEKGGDPGGRNGQLRGAMLEEEIANDASEFQKVTGSRNSRKKEAGPIPQGGDQHAYSTLDKSHKDHHRDREDYRRDRSAPLDKEAYHDMHSQEEEDKRRRLVAMGPAPEPKPRRQLPAVDKSHPNVEMSDQLKRVPKQQPSPPQQAKQQPIQNKYPYQQQQQQPSQKQVYPMETEATEFPIMTSSPMAKPRTLVSDNISYGDRIIDGKNGQPTIPRTVPLNSLTQELQQMKPKDRNANQVVQSLQQVKQPPTKHTELQSQQPQLPQNQKQFKQPQGQQQHPMHSQGFQQPISLHGQQQAVPPQGHQQTILSHNQQPLYHHGLQQQPVHPHSLPQQIPLQGQQQPMHPHGQQQPIPTSGYQQPAHPVGQQPLVPSHGQQQQPIHPPVYQQPTHSTVQQQPMHPRVPQQPVQPQASQQQMLLQGQQQQMHLQGQQQQMHLQGQQQQMHLQGQQQQMYPNYQQAQYSTSHQRPPFLERPDPEQYEQKTDEERFLNKQNEQRLRQQLSHSQVIQQQLKEQAMMENQQFNQKLHKQSPVQEQIIQHTTDQYFRQQTGERNHLNNLQQTKVGVTPALQNSQRNNEQFQQQGIPYQNNMQVHQEVTQRSKRVPTQQQLNQQPPKQPSYSAPLNRQPGYQQQQRPDNVISTNPFLNMDRVGPTNDKNTITSKNEQQMKEDNKPLKLPMIPLDQNTTTDVGFTKESSSLKTQADTKELPQAVQDHRKSKPLPPKDVEPDLEEYQDEEEEEDIDDYFQMIENAIGVRKPQVILGVKRSSDIQKQLMIAKESPKDQPQYPEYNSSQQKSKVIAKQTDIYNQQQQRLVQQKVDAAAEIKVLGTVSKQLTDAQGNLERNKGTMVLEEKNISAQQPGKPSECEHEPNDPFDVKKDSTYISQTDYYQRSPYALQTIPEDYSRQKQSSAGNVPFAGKPYDKFLMHELTADDSQPSAKHYLEEHKTQPVSYEVFSTVKALQTQKCGPEAADTATDGYVVQPHHVYSQQFSKEDSKHHHTSSALMGDNGYPKQVQSGSEYFYSHQSENSIHQTAKFPDEYDSNQSSSASQPVSSKSGKPNTIDLQSQKKAKPKPDPQDWSPVSDLSPIMDVSPSVEAAEQELMEKFQEKIVLGEENEDDDMRPLIQSSIPRATSGTISGMLEEFNRALGLPGTSPIDDSGIKTAVTPTSLAISPISAVSSITAASSSHQEGFTKGAMTQKSPQQSPQLQHGSPQKNLPSSQPGTPRRPHRRLPQPTVEQMQVAVAMAAQGPKERAALHQGLVTMGSGDGSNDLPASPVAVSSLGVIPSSSAPPASARPLSPMMMPWKTSEIGQSFEQAYKQQMNQVRSFGDGDQSQFVCKLEPTARSNNQDSVSSDAKPCPPVPASRTSAHSTTSGNYSATSYSQSTAQSGALTNVSSTTPVESVTNGVQARRMKSYGEFRFTKPLDESTRSSSPSLYVSTTVVTDVVTTEGSPQTPSTPRDKGGDSSDTQSEAESVKSVRMRRKLPNLPHDARSSPSPTRKNLERSRISPAPSEHESFGEGESNSYQSLSSEAELQISAPQPQPNNTLTSTTSYTTNLAAATCSSSMLPTTIESLRLSPNPHHQPSPLTRTQSPSRSPSYSSSPSPSPSRKAEQSSALSALGAPSIRTPSPLSSSDTSLSRLQESASPSGPKLPQYMQSLKQQLRDELKAVTEERKVMMELKNKDREIFTTETQAASLTARQRFDDDNTIMTTATTTVVTSAPQRYDPKPIHRKQGLPTTTVPFLNAPISTAITTGSLRRQPSPRTSPQASPKKGRRRHTSEITMPLIPPLRDAISGYSADIPKLQQHYPIRHPQQQYLSQQLHPIQQQKQHQQQHQQHQQQPQHQQLPSNNSRSLEFESLDGHSRGPSNVVMMRSSKYGGSLGSGLCPDVGHYRGVPQKTSTQGVAGFAPDRTEEHRFIGSNAYFQTLNNEINRLRRSSESIQHHIYEQPSWEPSSPQTTERRKRKEKKSRKPRSWHPSPYVSEDEDDQMTREEKKAKIKAEIARRRQQIEENTRLHEELAKLARRRERAEQMANASSYKTTSAEMMYTSPRSVEMPMMSRIPSSISGESPMMSSSDDTSSVLKAIDEILRKDLYSGPYSRASWATYNADARTSSLYTSAPSAYVTLPRTRYEYSSVAEKESSSWYTEHSTSSPTQYFPDNSAEDESIARIASTFPTDDSAPPDLLMSTPCATFDPICEFSPVTTDTETPTEADPTPAMPLLPDMPTRSRKLLENLGSSPIVGQPTRSASGQGLYQERLDGDRNIPSQDDEISHGMTESTPTSTLRTSRKNARAPLTKTAQKYDFPVKRILLTRDPKDRSVSGNGLGMKVVGGKEVPGTNGVIGAYVAKIFPGGVVETLGEVKEGDQVIEWNGIPLTGRTYEEVQRIIASSADEVEIVIRCDLNMLEPDTQSRKGPGMSLGCPGGPLDPPDTPGSGGRTSGTSPAQSPYSPVGSSRGHSPALTKRMMGGGGSGGGGSGVLSGGGGFGGSVITQGSLNGHSLSNASSYDNLQSPENDKSSDYCLYDYTPSPLESATSAAPIRPGESGVVTLFSAHPPQNWNDSYSSHPRSDEDDDVKDPWYPENNVEEVQLQVSIGPRAAIVYVPIIPVRPMVTVKENGYIRQQFIEPTAIPRKSMDYLPDHHPLLKGSNPEWKGTADVMNRAQKPHLGVSLWNYDLLRSKNSLGKVNLYINGLKDKDMSDFSPLYKFQSAPNGIRHPRYFADDSENRREETGGPNVTSHTGASERPKAPQDLPGLKPVFVNDWKAPKKPKNAGNDNNNNNSNNNNNNHSCNEKASKRTKAPVGSSPEATPYHILPKGCRGSFCALL